MEITSTATADISLLNERIVRESAFVDLLNIELGKTIVGQKYMIERLMIALLANGHILLEGVPGLAKTLAIKSLAAAIHSKFSRIQFTPDLLPADLIGTMIYNQKESDFAVKKGPVFANFVLADEINRAPAKTQSALLEAMQEKQVTIGVKGGGCSGMTYVLGFDEKQEGDQEFLVKDVRMLMNKSHQLYLFGMQIHYEQGLNARGFIFQNPNAKKTCGCGSSFSA